MNLEAPSSSPASCRQVGWCRSSCAGSVPPKDPPALEWSSCGWLCWNWSYFALTVWNKVAVVQGRIWEPVSNWGDEKNVHLLHKAGSGNKLMFQLFFVVFDEIQACVCCSKHRSLPELMWIFSLFCGLVCCSRESGCFVQVSGYSLSDKKSPAEVFFGSCILLFFDCCGGCQPSSGYKSWAITWHHKEAGFAGRFTIWNKNIHQS